MYSILLKKVQSTPVCIIPGAHDCWCELLRLKLQTHLTSPKQQKQLATGCISSAKLHPAKQSNPAQCKPNPEAPHLTIPNFTPGAEEHATGITPKLHQCKFNAKTVQLLA